MLDASKPPNRLFALAASLLPRQVMLDNLRTAAAAAAAATESADEKAMAKEEKEKSKKKHKAKTLEADGSGAPETLDLVRANGGAALGQRGKGRELLLSSIASFLKINGFARTLATFRSEAQLENSDKTTSYINLEDLFCKFLESSESHTHASLELPKDKDIEKSSISTKTEGESIHDASEHTHRKKRKHKNGTDDGAETMETEQSILVPEGCSTGHTEVVSDKSLNGKEKKKKKHKLNSDMCDVDAEPKGDKKFQEIVEEKIQELKALTNDPSLSGESKAKHKSEKKKKKDKLTSEDAVGSEQLDQGASSDVRKISEENVDSLSGESKAKHKGEKNKKKDKLASEDAVSSEQLDQGASSDVRKISEENVDILSGESKAKHKGEKKKKKDKLVSEDAVSFEQVDQGASSDVRKENVKDNVKISDIGKENIAVSEENVDSFEKKSHKKRKRLASEERVPQAENENLTKKSKHAKLEGSEGNEETHTKLNKSLSDSDCKSLGKKGKTEENNETSCQALKVSPSAQDAHVECEGQKLADGNLDQSGKEGEASSNRKKKEKQSAEPKTVNAFQRVKVDEVKFTDERLQDNSYWALDDSGTGYGAKAQEILGAVKGRGFRHEKTKKKRGSYRGGQIDLQSHSIKFNYSDDE